MTPDPKQKTEPAPKEDAIHAAHLSVSELIEQANPKPTADQSLALKISQQLEAEAKAEHAKQVRVRNLSALFYLHCSACERPALFFTRDPGTDKVMRNEEWFSALKPMGRPWAAGKLRCQHCNSRARAAYAPNGSGFIPAARFVRELPLTRPGVADIVKQIEQFNQATKGGVA